MSQPNPKPDARHFPWWLAAIALLGLLILWAVVADQGYNEIFSILVKGMLTTLWVAMVAFFLAMVLGLLVALARTSRYQILVQTATFYIEVIRGIPILVALFYIAFVGAPAMVDAANWLISPLVGWGLLPKLTIRSFDFTWRAIFALTIAYSAFIAEIFRAGIEAVHQGQAEAARALGLSPWRTFRHVIAPQALRTILPPLGNDFVSMIKDSALVSALGVQDITQLGKVYSSSNFKFFETYNVVAFLYLTMTISLSLLVRLLERHMARNRS
ncbi:amino acid ABC transporter permease [Devosia rhodophyticola]|uniref:Amino acid ABC transporter permease n=1 Tax=Devosia rhodophyticola TaxID=3026423 RepID=A0ABY7Z0I0_9HYPH|nr:amino acid ABC transporter permease [Devosia rhodophyticola]WDR07106.1 amino acid ABC transporter permease [Devosia rhodophyticola]